MLLALDSARLLEEAKSQASARSSVSREEHGRVVAENRQLAAQVGGGVGRVKGGVTWRSCNLSWPACSCAGSPRLSGMHCC